MAELKPSASSTRAVTSLISCFSCAKNPKSQPPLAAAVNPLASSCNSRVHSLIKAGDPAAAISVYKDFIREGIPPLYPTLTSLIYCFSLTKKPKLSFTTAGLILKSGHPVDTHVLNLLIKALCQSRKLDEAIEVFQQFARQRIPPDVITYNILIHGLIKEKRMERAMELWKDMDERDLQQNLVRREKISEMMKFLQDLVPSCS